MAEALTKKDIEDVLDKKFEQHQTTIIEAVDFKFKKIEVAFDLKFQQLEERMEQKYAKEETVQKLVATLDKFLSRLDKWEQEFTLLKADVDKIKDILKKKFGVEVSVQG